jgi:hypothetical protein
VNAKDVLFIDANQYLDLYGMPSGKKLLTSPRQLQGHILVTSQVVDEVTRNKVKVTANFLAQGFKKLELSGVAVPAHLLSDAKDRIALMSGELAKICGMVDQAKEAYRKLTHDVLEQVSQSRDEMSKGLDDLFLRAVPPNEGELKRAWARKERGNPPGKPDDPLGDELSWEQILSSYKDKPRLWIITKDSDYGAVYAGKMFLNAALYRELAQLYQSEPPVFCFHILADGIAQFARTTGAKEADLPTPEETDQIRKEQESLPPLGWLGGYDDSFQIPIQVQDAFRMMDSVIRTSARASQLNSDEVILPPATKQTDKEKT